MSWLIYVGKRQRGGLRFREQWRFRLWPFGF